MRCLCHESVTAPTRGARHLRHESVTARQAGDRLAPIGTTIPYSWYVDPEILRREQERIFRSAWQYAGHTGQPPEPGTFFTGAAGRAPAVVTRAADGELRAAPRSEEEPGFPRDELGLHWVAVDTWGPFVFVHASPDPEPLADALGTMPAQVAELGLDLDGLVHHSRWETELEANWKVVCENFRECHHCEVAHPGFSAVIDVSTDAYALDASGRVSAQLGPVRNSGRDTLDVAGADVEQSWIDELMAFDDRVGVEDRVLVEGVPRSVAAGALERGVLMGRSEQLIGRFQQLTAAALTDVVETRP